MGVHTCWVSNEMVSKPTFHKTSCMKAKLLWTMFSWNHAWILKTKNISLNHHHGRIILFFTHTRTHTLSHGYCCWLSRAHTRTHALNLSAGDDQIRRTPSLPRSCGRPSRQPLQRRPLRSSADQPGCARRLQGRHAMRWSAARTPRGSLSPRRCCAWNSASLVSRWPLLTAGAARMCWPTFASQTRSVLQRWWPRFHYNCSQTRVLCRIKATRNTDITLTFLIAQRDDVKTAMKQTNKHSFNKHEITNIPTLSIFPNVRFQLFFSQSPTTMKCPHWNVQTIKQWIHGHINTQEINKQYSTDTTNE